MSKIRSTYSAPVLATRPRALVNAKRYHSSTTLDTEEYQRLYSELPFTAMLGMPRRSVFFRRMLEGDESGVGGAAAAGDEADRSGFEDMTTGFTGSLTLASLLAMQSTFMFGYNTGVINAPVAVVFPGHSEVEWSLVVSIFCIGGLIGAYSGGHLANAWGRRGALLAASVLYIVSGLCMMLAPDVSTLVAGRFLVGIAAGASTVFVPIYIGEIAPPHLRGVLGAICQFHLVFGILAADLLAFPLATEAGWRYLFGFTCIPALLQLLLMRYLLESPRLLLMRGQHRKAAAVLKALRNADNVDSEVTNIVSASQNEAPAKEGGVFQNLGNPTVRFGLAIGIGLHLAQQLSGVNAVFYYSNQFFMDMGLANPLVGTTIVATINVLATVGAIFLMDWFGRRTLLLWSSGGMLLSTGAVTALLFARDAYPNKEDLINYLALVAVSLFVSFFEIGLGPVAWLMVAEIFTAKLRSGAMGIATLLNWTSNFAVGLCYPLIVVALGNYSWLPFAGVLLLTFFGSYLFVVETKDKTLEEIQEEIAARAGASAYGRGGPSGGHGAGGGSTGGHGEWAAATINMDKISYGAVPNIVGSELR